MIVLEEIDSSVFQPLVDHLSKQKRTATALGMTHKRSMAPDLSKHSWLDPRLYYLVMKYALVYLPIDFSFTTVQIHDSSMSYPKFDKQSRGSTYIVAFGSYINGEIVLKECSGDVEHNIRHRPMIFNTSTTEHFFKEFSGRRWTMAFHTIRSKIPMVRSLSDYEAVCHDGSWAIAWYRQGEPTIYLSKKNGLPMPTNKRKIKEIAPEPIYNKRFTVAQNLMLSAQRRGFIEGDDIDDVIDDIMDDMEDSE